MYKRQFQNFALVVLPPGFVAFDLDDRLVKEVFRQLFFPGHVLAPSGALTSEAQTALAEALAKAA